MPHVETHAPGDFCWIELATTDQSAAKEFYSELFGWTIGEFNKPDSRHGPTRQSHQIGTDKRYDSIGSAPEKKRWSRAQLEAGALSIGAFELSRWWFRRTRAVYGF